LGWPRAKIGCVPGQILVNTCMASEQSKIRSWLYISCSWDAELFMTVIRHDTPVKERKRKLRRQWNHTLHQL